MKDIVEIKFQKLYLVIDLVFFRRIDHFIDHLEDTLDHFEDKESIQSNFHQLLLVKGGRKTRKHNQKKSKTKKNHQKKTKRKINKSRKRI
jgi:hypothetical protein